MINAKFSGRIDAGSIVYIDDDFYDLAGNPRYGVHPNVFVLDDVEIKARNFGPRNAYNYTPKDAGEMQYLIEERDHLELDLDSLDIWIVDTTTGRDVEVAWINLLEFDYYRCGPRPCLNPNDGYVEPCDIEHLGAGYYLICEFVSDVMESVSVCDEDGYYQEVEVPFVVRFAIRLEVDE